MINRAATIRWKGYDPDELTKGSHKRVWVNCMGEINTLAIQFINGGL